MTKNILCPLALDKRDEKLVDWVLSLAGVCGSSVYLLHVIETIRDTTFEELKAFYEDLERKACERIDQIENKFLQKDISCTKGVVFGDRVSQILSVAEQDGSDLIALGAAPIEPDAPSQVLGTVSYKVGILAPCSVALIK